MYYEIVLHFNLNSKHENYTHSFGKLLTRFSRFIIKVVAFTKSTHIHYTSYFHLASFVTSTSCWCRRSSNFSGKYFLQTACMLRVTFYKIVNMHASWKQTVRINPDDKLFEQHGNIRLYVRRFITNCAFLHVMLEAETQKN